MRVVVRSLVVAESAQRFNHRVLRLSLAGVDHVVDFGDAAKVWMVWLALHRRYPAFMLVRIAVELAISKIAAEQTELPHVIGNIFADIADSAIRADNDFLIFFRDS